MPLLIPFKIRTSLILVLISLSISAHAQKETTSLWDVPARNGQHVIDNAKLLNTETVSTLENMLKNYEDSTGHQVMVLVQYDLENMLETYSRKVMSEWKLNKKDNVLLLIVEKKRQMRIEVGSELLDKLQPTECAAIIDKEIVPSFKEKDYDAGTIAGTKAILSAIHGTYPPKSAHDIKKTLMWIASGVVIIAAIVGLFSKYYSNAFFGGLLPFFAVTVGMTFSWWAVAGYVVIFPLLRLLIVKTNIQQLEFGKYATGGSYTEDEYDRMENRRSVFSTSSDDSSDSSSSSSSSDDSGASGSW